MSRLPRIDTSKSLAQLTGNDWGDPPESARSLVRERHETRRKPLRDLSSAEIVRFLDMGTDLEVLVPFSLVRLSTEFDDFELLCAVLRTEQYGWSALCDDVVFVRDRVSTAINQVAQIDDDLERLQWEAAVWRFYAGFERRLSAIR